MSSHTLSVLRDSVLQPTLAPEIRGTEQEASSLPASFRIRSRFEIVVSGYERALLSAPALEHSDEEQLRSKDLISVGAVSTSGKFTIEEHLDRLAARMVLPRDRPLLVFGLRNNLVNPRAMVVHAGTAIGADDEDPLKSARPYYGIGLREGRFVAEAVLGSSQSLAEAPSVFWAGVPVLWDDLTPSEIFNLLLVEASDHSHVFELARGNHPRATDESRGAWQRLHEVFREHLYSAVSVASQAMWETVRALPFLRRSEEYLHSVLGVDEAGNLINVVAHGRLEELGQTAAALGCRRAVCVENSGSVMPTFYPEGYPGTGIPLLRAPNFRHRGRALLVIQLADETFETLTGFLPGTCDTARY